MDSPIIHTPSGEDDAVDARTFISRRKLRNSCATVAAALYGWLIYQSQLHDFTLIIVGSAIYLLCVLPILSWIIHRRYKVPTIEAFLLSFLPTYAIPFLTAHSTLITYPSQTVLTAGTYTFLFMVMAGLVYRWTSGSAGRSDWWRQKIITENSLGILVGVGIANVAYVFVTTFYWQPPSGILGPLRAATSGMLIVSGFSLGRFWAEGFLTPTQRWVAGLLLILTFVMQISSLYLVTAATISMVCLLGYASAGKRMPWLAVLIIAVTLAVLHAGKAEMRAKYWSGFQDRQVTFTALPAFFEEWIDASMRGGEEDPITEKNKVARGLLERGSLVHMLCLVVNETPEPRPYLVGKTYANLHAQLIPRLLWPDKPGAHESTSILGIYYDLQREEDTATTTISFGQLSEAYANFGLIGCLMLGSLYGFLTKKIMCLTSDSPILSIPGVMLILYTSWLVDIGQTLAVWTGSLFQAIIGIGVLAWGLRNFTHE